MKILAIERLRAVAILMVYLAHVPLYGNAFGVFRPLRFLGTWAGVDLFFVISGFVVTLSLQRLLPERALRPLSAEVSADERSALGSFYVRRFFRLAPVAACALFLHFLGAALGPQLSTETPFLTVRDWALETVAIVTGLYNFAAPYLAQPALVFFWSLSVEEHFYLLLPALFLLAGTRRGRAFVAAMVLVAVALVIRPLWSPNQFGLAHFSSQYRFDALAAGVLLALGRDRAASVVRQVPHRARRALVILACGALLYVSRHLYIWFAIHNGLILIWAASALLVACAATDGSDVLDVPIVNRLLEHVGSRSYAVYVLHTAFLMADDTLMLGARGRLLAALTSRGGESVRFVVVFALVMAAAELAHRFVELPCIRTGKRVAAAIRGSSDPSTIDA